ncbi:tetratricopeptide repeat protein [Sporosarcina cyprini]|uniref:tetratricopeptide repeat protein n=1 Tax=Sporosarcina cyprini TaxID=2910523 RepID=UPI001EDD5B48|nr:tetratricopeptide repeat protein [Sporosarcina cyprini]MCG3089938.1 tetratricopeptide repeat protein [Sporosarcina cyprini]
MGQLENLMQAAREGNLEDLRLQVEQIISMFQQGTEEPENLYDLAGMMMDYGYVQLADTLYEELLQLMPEEGQLKIDRAETLLEMGEEDEALLLLTSITPDEDEYVQALLSLADYYQMSGMSEAAVMKVKEALALMPEEPVLRFAYAELLLDGGKYVEAASLYSELNDEGVNDIGGIRIVSRLAETYSAGAAYEEAIPYYEQLLKDLSAPDDLFGAAFAYFQADQPKRSTQLMEQLLELDPDYFSAYMLAGQSFARLGDDEKAYELFVRGITRDEYDKELRLAAGKSALKLGKTDEAEEHLSEALALDPEYIDALIALASLYNEQEKDEELLSLLAETDEAQMDLPMLTAFKAYALERVEQFDDAYVSYSEAYVGMKDDPIFLDRYAHFLLEEGKRSEAIEIVKQLVAIEHHDEWDAFLELSNDEEV